MRTYFQAASPSAPRVARSPRGGPAARRRTPPSPARTARPGARDLAQGAIMIMIMLMIIIMIFIMKLIIVTTIVIQIQITKHALS